MSNKITIEDLVKDQAKDKAPCETEYGLVNRYLSGKDYYCVSGEHCEYQGPKGYVTRCLYRE